MCNDVPDELEDANADEYGGRYPKQLSLSHRGLRGASWTRREERSAPKAADSR